MAEYPCGQFQWADSIDTVWLQNKNSLTGTLPEEYYRNWINIQEVSFSANCLEGPIPNGYRLNRI
jgi:hypothetical protein